MDEDLYLMSNLPPGQTGLPFVVWISRGNAEHDVRIRVSEGPRVTEGWAAVAIRPEVELLHGTMTGDNLRLLKAWVDLNRDILVRYWTGDIEYTEDVLEQLKGI